MVTDIKVYVINAEMYQNKLGQAINDGALHEITEHVDASTTISELFDYRNVVDATASCLGGACSLVIGFSIDDKKYHVDLHDLEKFESPTLDDLEAILGEYHMYHHTRKAYTVKIDNYNPLWFVGTRIEVEKYIFSHPDYKYRALSYKIEEGISNDVLVSQLTILQG